jgi:hypothetical protein
MMDAATETEPRAPSDARGNLGRFLARPDHIGDTNEVAVVGDETTYNMWHI